MKHKTLHELAKFGSGLVAADFLWTIWAAQAGVFPMELFGYTFTTGVLGPVLIFDAALFLVLIHYGWNIGKIPALRERTYLLVAGTVFGIVAIAHFARVFLDADLMLGSWEVPHWLSWLGIAVTTYLSYMSVRLATRMNNR